MGIFCEREQMEISEEELIRIQEKVENLKKSKFKQQMLPAWRPVPSFGSTMIVFVIFGVIFLVLGVTLYVMSDKIWAQTLTYECPDNQPILPTSAEWAGPDTNKCVVQVNIPHDVEGPIF